MAIDSDQSQPNPVLAEAWRGAQVESRHRGAVVVVRPDGSGVLTLGNVSRPVYPRSAVKALQALPLIETGAADRFGLAPAELALACASHDGAEDHVHVAREMLRKIGLDEDRLACGPHWPHEATAGQGARIVRRAREIGKPTPIHNNCSGKHAGMLALALQLGAEPAGYEQPGHPVQVLMHRTLEEMAGVTIDPMSCAIDGCSVPTWPIPLSALAHAFARFGSAGGLASGRAEAASRIRAACAGHPDMVAGVDRICTRVMTLFGERVFIKTGAEGVFCAALPDQQLGIALKIDDGAGRASEVAIATLIEAFLETTDAEHALLDACANPSLANWAGVDVGMVKAAPEFLDALAALPFPQA